MISPNSPSWYWASPSVATTSGFSAIDRLDTARCWQSVPLGANGASQAMSPTATSFFGGGGGGGLLGVTCGGGATTGLGSTRKRTRALRRPLLTRSISRRARRLRGMRTRTRKVPLRRVRKVFRRVRPRKTALRLLRGKFLPVTSTTAPGRARVGFTRVEAFVAASAAGTRASMASTKPTASLRFISE